MFKTFSMTSLFALLSLSAAHAQSGQPIRANVPFAFAVQNTVLQPGNYEVSYSSTSHILSLRSSDRNSRTEFVSAQPISGASEAHAAGKLVFGCYGESCWLTGVWHGADLGGQGLLLKPSRSRGGALAFTRAVSVTVPSK